VPLSDSRYHNVHSLIHGILTQLRNYLVTRYDLNLQRWLFNWTVRTYYRPKRNIPKSQFH